MKHKYPKSFKDVKSFHKWWRKTLCDYKETGWFRDVCGCYKHMIRNNKCKHDSV